MNYCRQQRVEWKFKKKKPSTSLPLSSRTIFYASLKNDIRTPLRYVWRRGRYYSTECIIYGWLSFFYASRVMTLPRIGTQLLLLLLLLLFYCDKSHSHNTYWSCGSIVIFWTIRVMTSKNLNCMATWKKKNAKNIIINNYYYLHEYLAQPFIPNSTECSSDYRLLLKQDLKWQAFNKNIGKRIW